LIQSSGFKTEQDDIEMSANHSKMKFILSFIFFVLSSFSCIGISREEALAPHLNQLMKCYAALPADYQQRHKEELDTYLTLFTTTNDIAWNAEWGTFIKNMGPEFLPCRPAVTEAMVVAETYQACYPSPESRIANIASVLFSEIPTNAIVFIHHDIFESILRIEQQASGMRNDVVLLNSARVMDAAYLQIAADRYPALAGLGSSTIGRVFEIAKNRKRAGDKEFENLQIINGTVAANGYDAICSLSLLLAQEIAKKNPARPALIMPSVREFWVPVPAWNSLTARGLFCGWEDLETGCSPADVTASWARLMVAAAPLNLPLQVRLSNTIGKTVNAAGFVQQADGDDQTASALFQRWGNRLKSLRIVKGEDIRIDENGQMIEVGQ
jgi:hypothetical protein